MAHPALETAQRDRLVVALFPAAALHAIVVFGITFDSLSGAPVERQFEVTLVQAPGVAPEDASHIAQADQRGSGDRARRDRAARADPGLPLPPAPREQAASDGNAGGGASMIAALTANRSRERIAASDGSAAGGAPEERLEALRRRLAALEATARGREEAASTAPRTRRLTALSARSAVEAEYLQQWRQRLETIGNAYYPRASLRYGLYGELLLRAVLRRDGSLESVELLESSGYAVLDEAALKVVRLAAPFAPFPRELAEKADRLEIVRRWDFAPAGG